MHGARKATVRDSLSQASSPAFDFFLLIVLSATIATLGLITDSAAVIIGAMLVAPLMSPILSVSIASITGNQLLFRRATTALVQGAVVAVLLATVLSWLTNVLPFNILEGFPGEVLARTPPSPFDLVIALARPQEGRERVRDTSRGVAMEMVVDRSGSMGAVMDFDGKRMTRLDVVKRVFREFAMGNGKTLKGRPNDLIGMITFARYPDTICPMTLAHDALTEFLKTVQRVKRRHEDGTALGDAISRAAARLMTARRQTAPK